MVTQPGFITVGYMFRGSYTIIIPRKVDQKDLEGFEMWCWTRVEKISWTDRVRNE
jgi:hypothetical protein